MLYSRAVVFLLTVAATSPQASLDSFQREAEKASGRAISIRETNELGANLGETYCDRNPVLINIRLDLSAELRRQVSAHELGHALLCGKGILSNTLSLPPTDGSVSIVPAIGAEIGSCYIDPLADAEAEKRGFRPADTQDEFFRRSTSHSKQEIDDFFGRFGDLAAISTALTIYCSDLRPHSFEIARLEAPVSDRPAVMGKLLTLRNNLGRPTCVDSKSCFVLTKRLRDEFPLQELVTVKNPETGRFE